MYTWASLAVTTRPCSGGNGPLVSPTYRSSATGRCLMMMKPSDPICCQGARDNGRNGVRLSCAISDFKSTFRTITTNQSTSQLVSLVRGHQKYNSVKSERVSSINLFCGHSVGLFFHTPYSQIHTLLANLSCGSSSIFSHHFILSATYT